MELNQSCFWYVVDLGCSSTLVSALITGEVIVFRVLAHCGFNAVARMLELRNGSTFCLGLRLSAGTTRIVVLRAGAVLRSDLPQLNLLLPHGALKVKDWSTSWMMKLETWAYLDALLIDPENRRAARVIRLALKEAFREPAVETGVVLLL